MNGKEKTGKLVTCPRCIGEKVIPMRAGGFDWCPKCGGSGKVKSGLAKIGLNYGNTSNS